MILSPRFLLSLTALSLLPGCSTGVFFADDNQEGHIGIVSVERVGSIAEVIEVESGKAPKLVEAPESIVDQSLAAQTGEIDFKGPEPASVIEAP